MLHPDDVEAASRLLTGATDVSASPESEYRLRRRDGVYRWHLVRVVAVSAIGDAPPQWVGVCVDIEERKHAEAALAARVDAVLGEREAVLAELHEARKMEAIGRLTGGVAHDFNNLLAATLSNLDVLRTRRPELADDELLAGAIKAAERGATLTAQMLAFARRQELKTGPVKLGAMVADMHNLLTRSLSPAVRLVIDIADDLPAVRADRNQLELAVLNLAINASDAMPTGGSLRIDAEAVSAPDVSKMGDGGGFVRLRVTDTGTGMDAATLTRATEPFFTTKGVGKGTGLGLSMVQGLAAQLGGRMDIASQPGWGTSISILLPQAGSEIAVVRPATAPEAAPALRHLRVLLVDDDVLVAMGTAAMLEDMGHHVVNAVSGAQALAAFDRDGPFDLVITDHAMPNMTGVELAAKLRAVAGVPIILATGYADAGVAAREAGMVAIGKPFRAADLALAIDGLMVAAADPVEPAVVRA